MFQPTRSSLPPARRVSSGGSNHWSSTAASPASSAILASASLPRRASWPTVSERFVTSSSVRLPARRPISLTSTVRLGDVFGVPLAPHNRWAGAKSLRATWIHHIEASLFRPLLIFDEAQEASPDVLSELRLLCSAEFDSRAILTVVFAGDRCFLEKLRSPRLQPLESRIRPKLVLDGAPHDELLQCLNFALDKAGCPEPHHARAQNYPRRARRRQPTHPHADSQ